MTETRAQAIVDQMNGTCQSIDHFIEDGEDPMDPVLADKIDEQLFECSRCGWWCELSEVSTQCEDSDEDDFCTDCED